MLVVLVLLSVMLLGGLAFARMTEIGAIAAGNTVFREASVQASEVGLNTAFTAVRNVADEDISAAAWYVPYANATDPATGLPTGVNWNSMPEIVVGVYSVRWIAERVCVSDGNPRVSDPMRQCLVRQERDERAMSRCGASSCEALDPLTARQFRITVRVTGPKGTQTWVQSLVTKG
jgi:Tfp pilus assembly protein PilX